MPAAAQSIGCGSYHVMAPNETLSRLAGEAYGDVRRYPVIHDANRDVIGGDPSVVPLGAPVYIPCLDAAGNPLPRDPSLRRPAAAASGGSPVLTLGPLIEAEALDAARGAGPVQVLDVRATPSLASGVIPGALSVPASLWLNDPTPGAAAVVAAGNGIDMGRPVVVAAGEGPEGLAEAALVYWLLRSLGADAAILPDAVATWGGAGLPLDAEPAPQPPAVAPARPQAGFAADPAEAPTVACPPAFTVPETTLRALDLAGSGATPAVLAELFGEDGDSPVAERLAAAQAKARGGGAAEPLVIHCARVQDAALGWLVLADLAGLPGVSVQP